jgi:hypothetical protein
MLGSDWFASAQAVRELSLIDDKRVIPWYVKAINTRSYELKFAALDALAQFDCDEALAGLKLGLVTKGADIGNCDNEAGAAQLAGGIRRAAACALVRSRHPEAAKCLLSMWNDPWPPVRIIVLHALSAMNTPESLELLRKMSHDPAEEVRNEALRHLKRRTAGQPPDPAAISPVLPGVKISLRPRKVSYFLGENILLDYRIDYEGDGRFFAYFQQPCRVIATDEAGNRVAKCGIPWHCHGSGGEGSARGSFCTYTVPLMRHCNFEKPGVYRIRVAHDLLWSKNDIPLDDPRWTETTLTLVMPDAAQARKIVEAMSQLPGDFPNGTLDINELFGGGLWARPGYPDFADYTCMRYPVYLPILAEAAATAKDGEDWARAGIAHIATTQATVALVGLLKHPNREFALRVAGTLADRLPGQRQGSNPYRDEDADPARVRGLWDPKLAGPVREFARKILAEGPGAKERESNGYGYALFILESLGTGEDMPAVVAALDALAGRAEATGQDREVLVDASRSLVRAGATQPDDPKSPGQIVQYMLTLKERTGFRPNGWEARCAGWLGHATPLVRETVMRNVPRPLPEKVKVMLPALLAGPDESVVVAALSAVVDGGDARCRDAVAKLVATTESREVWGYLSGAAGKAGIAKDEYLLMLVERLGSPELGEWVSPELVSAVIGTRWLYHGECGLFILGGERTRHKDELATAQAAWRKFIKANAEAIRRGKQFGPTDPQIVPGMFSAGLVALLDYEPREQVRNRGTTAGSTRPDTQPGAAGKP